MPHLISRADRDQAPRTGLRAALAGLSPSYFALVMATGIVAIAAELQGRPLIAAVLFDLNVVAYGLLWLLSLLRLAWHPRRMAADLADHHRGPGFFTTVAATCVLGSQMLLAGHPGPALALWLLGALLWFALTYAIFAALAVRHDKPSLAEGIHGGWLLAVVATQSVAVLGALLAAQAPQPWRLELNFLALSMWLWGGMLYIWTMTLIFYRYVFYRFSPGDLAPPYWINMGAMAISTLAGARLIANAPEAPFLASLLPFLKGFTVFYWATASWWIPMLVVLALWRHLWRRFPLRYDPLYWGAVFPLGMYAVCSAEMAQAMTLDFLSWIPPVFLYAALAAWGLTFYGMLRSLLRRRDDQPAAEAS